MSTEEIEPLPEHSAWDVHLPFSLLGFAIALFLLAQITSAQQGAKTMKWQLSNIDKQTESVTGQQKQADELSQKMVEPSKQATQLEARYTAILTDLVDLAKDDADSKKVVQKYGIQRNDPKPAADDAKK